MISAHFAEFIALALVLTGFAAVIWEIWVKDATLFGQIVTDVRRMAEPRDVPRPSTFRLAPVEFVEPANTNGMKHAA